MDYAIGVVSSEDPRLRTFSPGPRTVITPSVHRGQPDALESLLDVPETAGARDSFLEVARGALAEAYDGGHNPGWMRRDAALSIIAITDEDDASPRELDQLLDALRSVRGGWRRNDLTVSAVSGGPEGCSGPLGPASPAPRIDEVIQRTGGVSVSVCTQR